MIAANNPQLKSWIEVSPDSDFPIQNLPFGVFTSRENTPRLCSAIGDYVVDLDKMNQLGFFTDLQIPRNIFENRYLNEFIALGKKKTNEVRERISELLDTKNDKWNAKELADHFLYKHEDVQMLMPVKVNDYTDFYSSIEHATNIGTLFRDPENALLPNWRHLPVGYHGRASSIVVSDTPIVRPHGQQIPNDSKQPVFGPSKLLDFELEMGFVVGKSNPLGSPVSTAIAEDHIFGLILFNDWSARDIQKWEYVPLGPFLGKSFASTVAPWVITLEALEPFRVQGPTQEPAVLPYLQYSGMKNFDVHLEVIIQLENGQAKTVSNSNFKYMYWNMAQQLAHHTINGCNLNVGDMCASGTISGPTPDSYGSMLEISWKGTKPVQMPDGSERRFIHDGDTVIMKAHCEKNGIRIGFGDTRGKIHPAKQLDLA